MAWFCVEKSHGRWVEACGVWPTRPPTLRSPPHGCRPHSASRTAAAKRHTHHSSAGALPSRISTPARTAPPAAGTFGVCALLVVLFPTDWTAARARVTLPGTEAVPVEYMRAREQHLLVATKRRQADGTTGPLGAHHDLPRTLCDHIPVLGRERRRRRLDQPHPLGQAQRAEARRAVIAVGIVFVSACGGGGGASRRDGGGGARREQRGGGHGMFADGSGSGGPCHARPSRAGAVPATACSTPG